MWVMRYPLGVALPVAVALSQIGEFSFMLSDVGRELGILSPAATNALVATSIISIILNPLMYRAAVSAPDWLSARHPSLLKRLQRPTRVPPDLHAQRHPARSASSGSSCRDHRLWSDGPHGDAAASRERHPADRSWT